KFMSADAGGLEFGNSIVKVSGDVGAAPMSPQDRQTLARCSCIHIRREALNQLIKRDRVDSEYRSALARSVPQVVPAVLRVSVNVQIHSYLDFRKSSG